MTKPTLTAGITCQARGKSYAIAFPQAPDVLAAHRILDPERPDSASPVLLATSDIPRAALERYAELFRVKLLQAAGYSSARRPADPPAPGRQGCAATRGFIRPPRVGRAQACGAREAGEGDLAPLAR